MLFTFLIDGHTSLVVRLSVNERRFLCKIIQELYPAGGTFLNLIMAALTRYVCVTGQVDMVCHGKTEVFPDKDGSNPYAVSTKFEFL